MNAVPRGQKKLYWKKKTTEKLGSSGKEERGGSLDVGVATIYKNDLQERNKERKKRYESKISTCIFYLYVYLLCFFHISSPS